MATVAGSIKVTSSFQQTPTTIPGNVTPATNTQSLKADFTSGTTADKVDLKYSRTLTFASATAQTLDLSSLTDDYGGAVAFVKIRSLLIRVKSTTDGATLTVGAAATNPWAAVLGTTGTLIIQSATSSNQAVLLLTAPNTSGYAVSGSSKSLKLLPSSHAFDVDIEITGTSA